MYPKIFTLGSLTVDIFATPDNQKVIHKEIFEFPLGEKFLLNKVHQFFGGGASNTAVALSRFGISSAVIGAVGDDVWGNEVLQNLKTNGVKVSYLQKIKKSRTSFSLILNSETGRHVALFYPGVNCKNTRCDRKIFTHCEGVFLGRLSGGANAIFEIVRAEFKKHPAKFLGWNPGGAQLEKGLHHFTDFLPVVDVLFLNLEEAELFSGKRAIRRDSYFSSVKNCTSIFSEIFRTGFSGAAVITDGIRGAQVCDGSKIIFCSPPKIKTIDTLGAGDAFASTFFGAIVLQKNLSDALKLATLNSASVVSQFGTQPGLQSLRKLTRQIHSLCTIERKL